MIESRVEVVVAGHICLDVIPGLGQRKNNPKAFLSPGKLIVVGPAVITTGGSVSNTGIALHKLGISSILMGKVGDDLFGRAVLDILTGYGSELVRGMTVVEGETTSYSIVISPPGVDRMFLHCAGANDTFGIDDLDYGKMRDARLFHFGYPPIMRKMYFDGGRELEATFRRVRQMGLTTSLDMSMPDPESEAGSVDWRLILKRVLPYVDIFLPSLEETLFMLDRPLFDDLEREDAKTRNMTLSDGSLLGRLAEEFLGMGGTFVGLKLGNNGLYLRTTTDRARVTAMGKCAPSEPDVWTGREMLAPCFIVSVMGTTGAGDCTIAGFLAGILSDLPPEKVITSAVAVGACNVEKADATSGVPSWNEVQARLAAGWKKGAVSLDLIRWKWNEDGQIWLGPNDTDERTASNQRRKQ